MTLLDRLFKKSPFGPIIEHSKKVQECIELIKPVIKAWLREDWDEIERLRYEISRKENEADQLKRTIRSRICSTNPLATWRPKSVADGIEAVE